MLFKGSGVAIVTPFDKNKKVNYKKFEELLNFHLKNKTDAVIIAGTTGESSTLDEEEKLELFKIGVKVLKNKIKIIAGTGSNNTYKARKLTSKAREIGVDACLIVAPYYNKTNQNGIIEHYKYISKENLPIILYNVPSRTGINILPTTCLELSKIKNIIAIKEASGNISQVAEISRLCNKEFSIYSGNDDIILPVMSLGGIGVISVLANIFPNETHDICENYFNKDCEASKNLQLNFLNLINNLFCDINPMPIKFAMNYLGFDVGECRMPLTDLNIENQNKIIQSIKKLNI
ncbi:MAG: 4-hydroxy-tetrahydrodipicolinate synthase [Clostridiales bacterium]|nr:4-hydroxy-tetrahydrodipicolinate synthase [Clostridiales bacterium]